MKLFCTRFVVAVAIVVGLLVGNVFAERPYPTGAAGDTTEQQVPVAIPGAGIWSSFITAPTAAHTAPTIIQQVRVQIYVNYPAEQELVIQLISPNATIVTLCNQHGIGTSFEGTIFSDSAAASITTVATPGTGYYMPEFSLSAFNGETAVGTWELRVTNAPFTNVGTIDWWSIEFVGSASLPVEMTSFTATGGVNQVQLRWHTETESNNAHFNLYRSLVSGTTGNQIAQVIGHGTTAVPNNYSFTDTRVSVGTRYYYRIADVDVNGVENLHSMVVSAIPTIRAEVPNLADLNQNYPNPFNPTTEIIYHVRNAGNVQLAVYDVMGNKIATLVNGLRDVNTYRVQFDASHLPAGMYFYTMKGVGTNVTKKMILMK